MGRVTLPSFPRAALNSPVKKLQLDPVLGSPHPHTGSSPPPRACPIPTAGVCSIPPPTGPPLGPNAPKFVAGDAALFAGIVADLFPGLRADPPPDGVPLREAAAAALTHRAPWAIFWSAQKFMFLSPLSVRGCTKKGRCSSVSMIVNRCYSLFLSVVIFRLWRLCLRLHVTVIFDPATDPLMAGSSPSAWWGRGWYFPA